MHPLSANDIITIWELGQRSHPLERAILILSVACPDRSQQELAMLSVGQRDRRLLALRQMTMGSRMQSVISCPNCGDRLEFAINVSDICVGELSDDIGVDAGKDKTNAGGASISTVQIGAFECQFRLPNSLDLALLTAAPTPEEAYLSLIKSCVLHVSQAGIPIAWDALPSEVMAELAQQISSRDAQAEILLDLDCPACQHRWQTVFDIVSFFWAELDALARRLLQEVHQLAKAYGWREADILSMSATRRQFYLELVM